MPLTHHNQVPDNIRDQYLYIADKIGRRILGDRLAPSSATEITPGPTDGLVVVSQYDGPEKGWQKINWAKFFVPDEGIEEWVSRDIDPDVYENDFSKYTIAVLKGFIDRESVRAQAFEATIPSQNNAAQPMQSYAFSDKRRPDAAAIVLAEPIFHFPAARYI